MGFSFVVNILLLVPSIYMMAVFDRVIPGKSVPTLVFLSLGAFFLIFVMMLLEHVRARLMIAVSSEVDRILGPRLIDGLLGRALMPGVSPPSAGFRDVMTLRTFLSGPTIFGLFDAPWMPLYIVLIFFFSPVLGWFAIFGTLLLVSIGVLTEFMTRNSMTQSQVGNMRSSRFIEMAARNAEVVTALNMKRAIKDRWAKLQSDTSVQNEISSDRVSMMLALAKFARVFVQMGMMAVGVYLLTDNSTSPGVMMAATFIMSRAVAPVEQLVGSWTQISEARGAYRRLSLLMETMPITESRVSLPEPVGMLRVEQVVFAVPGGGRPILRGLSFDVGPGESLGIVGPSASGKSTLARLLTGVWQPVSGSVRLDGATVNTWVTESQRYCAIGYLPQDVELFAGTVADNIARMGPVDDDAVVAAAMLAGVHEMILRLPKGYDTEIGESGGILSGGQRQRIGLARALYGQPKLIILDEPNASLDSDGEEALMRAFAQLKSRGVTLVVIAHRPAIFAGFDKLMILKEGVIECLGPRQDVLSRYGAPMPQLKPEVA